MTQIDRLIQTAVGELGYTESSTSTGRWNKYANDFDTKPGWTEWFNTKKNGADWCTIFHDWCYVKTFGFNKAVQMLFNQDPYSSLRAGCAYLERLYSRNGRWGSTPKVGAQVVFGVDHTGIVIAIRAGYVYTIEGKYSSDRDTLRVECKSAVFHADFLLLRLSRFGNSTGLDASS
ncbi:MAG TPA: CHAP domain-containing protein [Candidatus Faecimorpha stercoravium]|nr:CHAP domain-containing protein [Candidatus Faecimorpha stercoravium]